MRDNAVAVDVPIETTLHPTASSWGGGHGQLADAQGIDPCSLVVCISAVGAEIPPALAAVCVVRLGMAADDGTFVGNCDAKAGDGDKRRGFTTLRVHWT